MNPGKVCASLGLCQIGADERRLVLLSHLALVQYCLNYLSIGVMSMPYTCTHFHSLVCLDREPGIASVVNKDDALIKGNDPRCQVCEMAVIWAQNQLRQNRTREQIDTYLNQVSALRCELFQFPKYLMLFV